MNVDGEGSRCRWWYRRPRHESQRIRLVESNCQVNPLWLYKPLRRLVERGLVKRTILYLRDPLSVWGRDRHVLYYITEDQLRRRVKVARLDIFF